MIEKTAQELVEDLRKTEDFTMIVNCADFHSAADVIEAQAWEIDQLKAWKEKVSNSVLLAQKLAEAEKESQRLEWIIKNSSQCEGDEGFELRVWFQNGSGDVRSAIDEVL